MQDFTKSVDYADAMRRYKMGQGFLQHAMAPQQRATPLTALGRVLTAYLANKGMKGATGDMRSAEHDAGVSNRMATQSLVDAYRGHSPGESARTGLDIAPKNDQQALISAMMSSPDEKAQYAGLSAALATPKDNSTALQKHLVAAGYIPGTPEYQTALKNYLAKKSGMQINMPPNLERGERPEYDENGNLIGITVIPGSQLDLRMKAEAEEKKQAAIQSQQQTEQQRVKNTEFLGQIDKALENNTFWTTGMVGKIMSVWSGSDAAFQVKLLERIQGEVALNRLAAAQAASKTGGVFGSLQREELNLLKNSLEALEVGMSEDQMGGGLKAIKEHRLKWEGYEKLWNDPAVERGFYGFGGQIEDDGGFGVEILDEENFNLYQIEARTGIKQNYKRMGVYR